MNPKRKILISSLTLLVFASLALLVVACGQGMEKGDKASADWSRSLALGEGATGSIGLALNESGEQVHVVWLVEEAGRYHLQYVQLDEQANPAVEKEFNYPGRLRSPRLAPAGSDQVHLLWASRQPGQRDWVLWHSRLNSNGESLGEAINLSSPDENVGQYVAAPDGSGGVALAWDGIGSHEIRLMHIGPAGEILAGPVTLSSQGEAPSLRVDDEGQIHLAWLADRHFYYASALLNDLEQLQATEVVNLDQWGTLNTSGDSLDGPVLGIDDGWVYLFWTIVSLTDTEAGSGVAEYVAFPAGSPSSQKPARLWAIPAEDQPYVAHANAFSLSQLSEPRHIARAAEEYGVSVQFVSDLAGDWVNVSGAVSDYILSPASMLGSQEDLAVALAASQEYGMDKHMQIATALFSEGQYLGYSFAAKTPYLSDDPVLATDAAGNLHVVWREGANGQEIHYATTAAKAKNALDRFGAGDLASAAPQTITDTFASLAFAPFVGFCWILPGLLLIGGWQLLKDQDSLAQRSTWIPLILALVLYYVAKLLFLPTFGTYVPFSAWLYIPPAAEGPLRLVVPLIILLISAFIAGLVRRRRSDSPVLFFLAWVMTDGLLTLAIYGVNLLGTF